MTESEARDALLAHGVPEVVLDVWRGSRWSSPIRIKWSKPNFHMAKELEGSVPGLAGLIPMFEQNGEAVVGYLARTNRFVRYYYEDADMGDAATEVMGAGYQQFAGKVLLEFEESGLSKYFDELVTLLEFQQGPVLRALLDADPYDDDAVERFHSRLVAAQ